MSNMAVAELAMLASAAGQSPGGGAPTAQQAARFEQQVQAPMTDGFRYYQSPASEVSGASGNWPAVMHDLGQISEKYRTESTALDDLTASGSDAFSSSPGAADPARATEVFAQRMSTLSHLSFTMMNVSFVTSAEQLAGANVRSLYQLT
jgi:hypothetical protein